MRNSRASMSASFRPAASTCSVDWRDSRSPLFVDHFAYSIEDACARMEQIPTLHHKWLVSVYASHLEAIPAVTLLSPMRSAMAALDSPSAHDLRPPHDAVRKRARAGDAEQLALLFDIQRYGSDGRPRGIASDVGGLKATSRNSGAGDYRRVRFGG